MEEIEKIVINETNREKEQIIDYKKSNITISSMKKVKKNNSKIYTDVLIIEI